jgi:hypothetical protein
MRIPQEHNGPDELFGIVVGFAVVMLALRHMHGVDEPSPQVVDEARLGARHIGYQ